ncbi:MAG: NYN domain-containing protein [Candidatus Nealsonbacteria bacterium]|nr:NYN domain-containing protein [Candidatus Nealsonbacteria bacterium]
MNPTRVAVFIDNSNIYKYLSGLRKIDKKWTCLYDPSKLAKKLAGDRTISAVYFYCTPPPPQMLKTTNGREKYSIQTKYYAEVQKLHGVEVKFGNLQGVGGELKEKNLDTQLTANMISLAAQNAFDVAILVSNDRDYVSALEPTKNIFGKKIEIVYFKGFISNSLLRLADVPRRARRSFFERLNF